MRGEWRALCYGSLTEASKEREVLLMVLSGKILLIPLPERI